MHIIPRKQGDHLQGLLWQPQQPKYDLGGVAAKVKDRMWNVKYVEAGKPKVEMKSEPLRVIEPVNVDVAIEDVPHNEIEEAIQKLWKK